MNKALTTLAALFASIALASADGVASITTAMNLQLTLATNGTLDGPPAWSWTGPGDITVAPNGMSGLLVTTVPGTNTITVVAHSFGTALTNRTIVTITGVPATVLVMSATAVPK